MNARVEPKNLENIRLTDKYEQTDGTVFLTGNQALVRIAVDQRRSDESNGLKTGGFISGYRGSPLGRLDMELWSVASLLKESNIHFQPGVNEDLAATAVWGSQYVGSYPGAKVQGVFGIWYGKGPGVDRSGDAFKHANLAGTSKYGGVIVLAGDDHSAKSSTTAHQSDYSLMAAGIPILYPSNVQEILDYGLAGIRMSRLTGCWIGVKLVTDVVESSGAVSVGNYRKDDSAIYKDLGIRVFDTPLVAEERLHSRKLAEVVAYSRTAEFNTVIGGNKDAKFGIVTAGKSYGDTLQALDRLGIEINDPNCSLKILKLGMVWPIDDVIVREFAINLSTILVVEEKRPLIEGQIKSILYDFQHQSSPRVIGKFLGSPEYSAERGDPLLPACSELSIQQIRLAIEKLVYGESQNIAGTKPSPSPNNAVIRKPSFCSGCPHNTSTKVPDGSRALAGIGCHTIAMLNNPQKTNSVSHMGGEGVMWMGQAPFTSEPHVFANMGDGTYFHSGYLAIRQAIAANLRMTYKLLFNGFVSMTGGQPIDGDLTVDKAVAQLKAEGAKKIVIVTDDLHNYDNARKGKLAVPVFDRSELDSVQKELREYPNLSIIIYDQACATEKRRLRKRGQLPDPQVRTYINKEVCEGCGDCGEQSGCLSIEPVETDLGRKRKINQDSCNKDLSCVRGFCPSFVTLEGAKPKKNSNGKKLKIPDIPEIEVPLKFSPVSILVSGIGGTGVVTLGAISTMAAHLDGNAGSSLDVTGLSQKYGAVGSHIRLANSQKEILTAKIGLEEADVLIGCDLIVASGLDSLSRMRVREAIGFVNTQLVPTSDFTKQPDWNVDTEVLKQAIMSRLNNRVQFIDATLFAMNILGDAILSNMVLFGLAWQNGRIPLSLKSIFKAIELNGVAKEANINAFQLGRWLAHDSAAVHRQLLPETPILMNLRKGLSYSALVEDRRKRLVSYQNSKLSEKYSTTMSRLQELLCQYQESSELLNIAATQYYRVLAVKDEYEVARLYSRSEFRHELESSFDGKFKVRFHLAGGPFGKANTVSGEVVKTSVGQWIVPFFKILSMFKFIRGTFLDPFSRTEDAHVNRKVLEAYESDLAYVMANYASLSIEEMKSILSWPELVRGYGRVRFASAESAFKKRSTLKLPNSAVVS